MDRTHHINIQIKLKYEKVDAHTMTKRQNKLKFVLKLAQNNLISDYS
jgi:hypothetical protein